MEPSKKSLRRWESKMGARITRMRLPLLFLLSLSTLLSADISGAYRAEIERWRREKEEKDFSDLRLMMVSRIELHEGKFSIGTAGTNNLVLPIGPSVLGTLELHGKTTSIELQRGLSGIY